MRKNVKKTIKSILSLLEEAESYEFYKQNFLNSIGSLFRDYQAGKYSHAEYDKLLKDALKGKSKEWWISYYDSYIYSILKQVEPMLSQVIYLTYNDDSTSKLRVKKGFEAITRSKAPVIEEDKKHVLKGIREKEAEEFVEFERQPVIGKPVSPLKEKFEEDIGKIREEREKKPVKVEVKLPEKKERKNLLSKLFTHLGYRMEKRKLEKKKRQIKKEMEKIKKPSLFLRISGLFAGLKPELKKKPKPVKVRKPSWIADMFRFRKKEKLELRKPLKKPKIKLAKAKASKPGIFMRLRHVFSEAKPSELVIPEAEPGPKAKFVPKKDRALAKLMHGLDGIDRTMTELKVKEPKISLKMRIDLLIIRIHTALKRKKIARAEVPEEIEKPEKIEIPEIKAEPVPEKVAIITKVRSGVKSMFGNIKKVFMPKPAKPELKAKPVKIEAPKREKRVSVLGRLHASLTAKMQKLKGFFYVKPKVSVPEAGEKAPETALEKAPVKAPEKAAKTKAKFRFSWESIKESYRKMMAREKKFVAKKVAVTPSLQMQALKEKVRVVAEEEKITPKLLKEEVESIKKIVEERKKFKIYQPSFIGSFANAVVRKFAFYLIEKYPSFFKTLYDNLRLANISILSNTYVNIMLLTTTVVAALSSVFFFGFFLFTNNPLFLVVFKTLIMVLLVGGVTFLLFYSYPQMKAGQRRASIDTNLPFAINHIAAVAGSGVPPTKMFKLIMESEEYGEIAVEIEKIVEYVELFGYDLLTAIRTVALTSPSIPFKEFLEGVVSTIESGGDLSVYLKQKTSDAMLAYDLERQKYTETISTYSDVYTGILIAAPLFFIVALSLVSMLGGTIGGLDVSTIIVAGAYMIIPLLNIIFIMILELTQPKI